LLRSGLLRADLASSVHGDASFDRDTCAAYSADPANDRTIPLAVVAPNGPDDAVAAISVCRDHDVPVVSYGAGIGLTGRSCDGAVMLDWGRDCDRLISLDVESRTAVVEPGITLAGLNENLAEHGLMLGHWPSIPGTATIGAMIDNFGGIVDSVRSLDIVTYDGMRAGVGETSDAQYAEIVRRGGRHAELLRGLMAVRNRYVEDIRRGLRPRPGPQTGYNLASLLPENRFHLGKLLVGSQGRLATILRAELCLRPFQAGPQQPSELPVVDFRGFGDGLSAAFGEVKRLFDPAGRMNPGKPPAASLVSR